MLDGGYESWVHHFPKNCTNPDKVTAKVLKPKHVVKRKTVPSSLPRTLSDVKATPIYPALNKDAEPKPTLLTKNKAEQVAAIETAPSVVINMQQPPQTIQIKQWTDEKPKSYPSQHTVVDTKPNKGSFKVTDVYMDSQQHEIALPPLNASENQDFRVANVNHLQQEKTDNNHRVSA